MSTYATYHKLYVMTGVVGADGEVVDGTMSPVADTFVAYGTDERFEILKTDATGALRAVGVADGKLRTFQPFVVPLAQAEKSCANKRLFILPDHVVRDSWLLQKGKGVTGGGPKPGPEFLRKWAAKLSAESDIAVTPAIKRFGVAQLMKPDAALHSQSYAAFHQSLKRDNCPCLFIPRTRVLVAQCSRPALQTDANIELQIALPSGAPQEVKLALENPDNAPSYHIAMLVADQAKLPEGHTTLPEGVYTFTIRAADLNQDLAWCEHVKLNGLTIQAHVTFNIRTLTTEIALVHLDPVSLEDALLQQFPERLGKEMAEALDADTNDSTASRALKVLGNWREKAEWVKSNYTLGNKLHQPGGLYGKGTALIQFGINHGLSQEAPPWFLDTFKLATGGIDYVKQYADFLNDADHLESIRKGLEALGSSEIKDRATRALKVLKERVDFKSDLYKWSLLSEGVKARGEYAILDTALDVEKTKPVGWVAKTETFVPKALDVAALALEAMGCAEKSYDAFVKRCASGDRRAAWGRLVAEYVELFPEGFCCQAMAVLERYRQALLASLENADRAVFEAIWAGVNLALSAAALIPGAQFPAALVMVGKSGVEGAVELSRNVTEALDRYLLENRFAARAQDRARMKALSRANRYSLDEIGRVNGDGNSADARRQLLIRSEVLSGMVGLIERAGSKADQDPFDATITDQYRLADYIEFFVLGKHGDWICPRRPGFPLTLDAFWHRYLPKDGGAASHESFRDAFARKTYDDGSQYALEVAAFGTPLGPTELNDASFGVNFQKRFPIHYVNSGLTAEGLRDLANTLRLSYAEVPSDFIEAVLVYQRAKPGDPWEPVWTYDSNDAPLIHTVTPLTQIRICVVGKRVDAEGDKEVSFPVSIKLVRYGYLAVADCEGPIYKTNTSVLEAGGDFGLLTEGPGAQYEKPYHGAKRQGAVFYPFYGFGGVQFCGLKPFQKDARIAAERMHQVSIDVSVGGKRARRFFYPPKTPGEPALNRRAEIPLWFNLHNATIGQSQKMLELQNRMYGDLNFIKHDSYDAPKQPSLAPQSADLHIVGVFLKSGSTWRYFDERKAELRGGAGSDKPDFDFAWANSFEMIVLLGLDRINAHLHKSVHHNWRRVPLRLQWEQRIAGWQDKFTNTLNAVAGTNVDWSDKDGPSYSTPFHYVAYWSSTSDSAQVGDIEKKLAGYKPGLHWEGMEEEYQPEHDAIDSPEVNDAVENYVRSRVLEPHTKARYLYMGHFRFGYEAPKGSWLDALRPFGKIEDKDRHVDYAFSMTDTSGGRKTFGELTLRLPSPLRTSLPVGIQSGELTPRWLDVSKADLTYLSLTREMARNVGS